MIKYINIFNCFAQNNILLNFSTPQSLDKMKQKEMQTAPLDIKKLMMEKVIKEKPNVMKQRNGFPPNFIHSLDSSHMMLTSLYL